MVDLAAWVVSVVERFGYGGVAFLVAAENVFPPVPSEIVLPVVGFAAARGAVSFWGAVLAASLGAVAGALVLYALGRRIRHEQVRGLAERHGRWVFLKGEDVDRADAWFRRHGAWAVLTGRLVPGIRSFVSIPAGAYGMPVGKFVILTALGSGAWNFLLIGAGHELGAQWHLVGPWLDRVGTGVWLVVALLVLTLVARRVVRHRRERRHDG